MADALLYVNARIKSLENGLLSSLQISRLADAESVSEACKILQECGFSNGLQIDDYKSYENLIAAREREAASFFKENVVEKSGMEAVLLKNDYHNAKVLIKAKYLRLSDVSDMLLPDGLFVAEKMKADIFDDDYAAYPKYLAEALDAVDVAFANGNRSPRYIDVTVDKAMFGNMRDIIAKGKDATLVAWLALTADTSNISSFIRSRKLGLDKDFFDEGFVEGGKLDKDFFDALYESSDDAFKEKMRYTDYGAATETALSDDNGLVRFETAVDNMVVKLFKDNKYDMFSVAPIVGFYFGKLTEIKVVKLCVSAIKNNLDKNLLRQRLRELYA